MNRLLISSVVALGMTLSASGAFAATPALHMHYGAPSSSGLLSANNSGGAWATVFNYTNRSYMVKAVYYSGGEPVRSDSLPIGPYDPKNITDEISIPTKFNTMNYTQVTISGTGFFNYPLGPGKQASIEPCNEASKTAQPTVTVKQGL